MTGYLQQHLAASASLLVLAALAAAFIRGWWLGYPAAGLAESILSAKEQEIVAASSDALFPAIGPMRLSGSQAGAVAYFDRLLRGVPPRHRLLLRMLLLLVEHGPWIFSFQRRLTRQSPQQRSATMEGWRTSELYLRRAAFTSLRTFLTMAYLANPEVASALGVVACRHPFALELRS